MYSGTKTAFSDHVWRCLLGYGLYDQGSFSPCCRLRPTRGWWRVWLIWSEGRDHHAVHLGVSDRAGLGDNNAHGAHSGAAGGRRGPSKGEMSDIVRAKPGLPLPPPDGKIVDDGFLPLMEQLLNQYWLWLEKEGKEIENKTGRSDRTLDYRAG